MILAVSVRQTATAEVLQVINASPGDLAPVFEAILEKAHSRCAAGFGTLFHFDGKLFDFAANYGTPTVLVELQKRRGPFLPEVGGLLDRVLQTRQVAHSADYAAELSESPPVKLGGARSTVAAAADRHRRRAEGHQPVSFQPHDGAYYIGRIGGAALRG